MAPFQLNGCKANWSSKLPMMYQLQVEVVRSRSMGIDMCIQGGRNKRGCQEINQPSFDW
jgi:hypothetical protein